MSFVESKWFKTMIAIILFLVIVTLIKVNEFLLNPLFIIIKTIFVPFVIAGILYYLVRPIVRFLETKRVPKWAAILTAFIVVILAIYGLFKLVGPMINEQLERFIENVPFMFATVMDWFHYVQENRNTFPDFIQEAMLTSTEEITAKIESNLGNIASGIISVFGVIGGFITTIINIVIVPLVLFYMLKDSERFAPTVAILFPKSKRVHVVKILKEMDKTIASYIQGQMLVSVIVGILLLIGYLIIGLNYSLVLALFGMLTNVIPFLGPFIAVAPALLVALFQEPIKVVYVIIVMLIAQQIEGNIISPNVMGKTLNIHPLTIIVLILAAGNLAGLVGIIFIIPAYSVAKVIVINIVKIFRKEEN